MFNAEPWNEHWTEAVAQTYLQDLWGTPRALGFVAVKDGEPVGFIFGHGEVRDTGAQLYIAEMCVLTAQQGQGIGKGLVGRLEATLIAQSVTKIYLLTARGGAAEAFYHACCFYSSEKMAMLGKYI